MPADLKVLKTEPERAAQADCEAMRTLLVDTLKEVEAGGVEELVVLLKKKHERTYDRVGGIEGCLLLLSRGLHRVHTEWDRSA